MADADSTLSLVVGGRRFGGWLSVSVTASLKQAARRFDIACTQRWPGQDERFEIPEGARCEVYLGNDKVLTGYVDAIGVDRDGTSASCRISGRSKTCDLVDCSPDFETTELAGLSLSQVARKVAAPFGIDVVVEADGPIFPVAAAHHGETCWKLIERLARQCQVLVTDDAEGRLVLTRLGDRRSDDALVHPSDGLLKVSSRRDSSKRFSEYRVKAQAGGRWSDAGKDDEGATAEALSHVQGGPFLDRGVGRYRPKTILSEGAAQKEGADARAEWECRRNIAEALQLQATRVGWRQSSGALWMPNLLVAVKVPAANIEAELALGEVLYRKDAGGELVELTLSPLDAFTPEPPESGGIGGQGGGRWGDVLKGDE